MTQEHLEEIVWEPVNKIVRISVPAMPVQVVRYVPYSWPKPVRQHYVTDDWPLTPELPYSLYKIESPHWNGCLKVRKMMIEEFGEDRAVRFAVWGFLLMKHGKEWQRLFKLYGRHEVRKQMVESIRYEFMYASGEEAP